MNAFVLLLAAAIPPDAPPVMPPVAPPVVESVPDHVGEPTLTVLPCQCGDVCECDPCECPGCPHKGENDGKQDTAATATSATSGPERTEAAYATAAAAEALTTERRPPLTIVTAFTGCAPCNRFKSDAIPRLQAAGWVEGRDFAVYTMPLGTVPMPSFSWRQNSFGDGYGVGVAGWNKWRAELAEAMGDTKPVVASTKTVVPAESVPRVMHDAKRHEVAKPVVLSRPASVMRADYHVHVCRRCGNSWSHHDSNAGNAAAHRCQRCGAYEYQIRSHSGPGPAGGVSYSQPAYRSGCPGGVCPPRSRGLFGGLFR